MSDTSYDQYGAQRIERPQTFQPVSAPVYLHAFIYVSHPLSLTERFPIFPQLLIRLRVIMDNHLFGQNIPPHASRVLLQHQRRRLPEHARIESRDLFSVPTLASVTNPAGTLSEPAVTSDSLSGKYFSRWALHRRLNIFWEQLDVVVDHADLNTVVQLVLG